MIEEIPIHLIGYPVFQKLKDWKQDKSLKATSERRSWRISSFEINHIRCTLNWVFGNGQMAGSDYTAPSAEEAVFMNLERFEKWSTDYYSEKEIE